MAIKLIEIAKIVVFSVLFIVVCLIGISITAKAKNFCAYKLTTISVVGCQQGARVFYLFVKGICSLRSRLL